MKKKALMVSTIIGFLSAFEISDIKILQSMGYEVHCACNCSKYADEKKIQKLKETGILEHHIPFARNPLSRTNADAYRELKRVLSADKFDLVHCHTPVGGVLGRLAAKSARVPVIIYTAHGFHFFIGCPIKNKVLFYPIEKHMSRYTDFLITINNEDYEVAKQHFHAKQTMRIHGVGIDIDRFATLADCRAAKRAELGLKDSDTLLLSVGELDRDKNHIEVLKAMESLAPKGYKYIIAGDGALKKSHQQFINQNNLEKSVQLLGYRRDIPELLQAADIYVFPSLFEGLSVALMEAVAARLPIACSEVRGNVDTVITPESYFPTNSPQKLAEVIEQINSMTEEEKEEMAEKNFQNLLKYRLSEVQKEMRAIYKSADEMVEKVRKNV